MDSVYHVTLLFPHRGSDLRLNFAAPGLQRIAAPPGLPDEFWGLDGVVVEALPASAVKPPGADRSRTLLETAASADDPVAANEAFTQLLAGGGETRAMLRRARDDAGVNWVQVDQLVDELASGELNGTAN